MKLGSPSGLAANLRIQPSPELNFDANSTDDRDPCLFVQDARWSDDVRKNHTGYNKPIWNYRSGESEVIIPNKGIIRAFPEIESSTRKLLIPRRFSYLP